MDHDCLPADDAVARPKRAHSMTDASLEDRDHRILGSMDGPASASDRVARYTQALRRIRVEILAGVEIDAVLQAFCSELATAVPGADLVGVSILDRAGRPRTVASTNPAVNDIDTDQHRAGEGPSLEAAQSNSVIRARADEAKRRWPRFFEAVEDLGVSDYLAAPLVLDENRCGSLNIYCVGRDGFDHIDEASIAVLATSIETVVALTQRARAAEREVDGLRTAMRTRSDIDQAKGIIMALRGMSADHAFALLSEQSQNRNIKVSEIAAAMIRSITRQSDDSPLGPHEEQLDLTETPRSDG